jgi:RNA polymerase sigma factor (sigma-70 family)
MISQKSSLSEDSNTLLLCKQRAGMRGKGFQESADGELITAARAGNQDAFEVLVHRYSAPLWSFIRSMLGNEQQADDVMQQVFLKLYLSLPSLQTDGSLKPWLFQVAHHCCVDELRRRRHICFSELEAVDDEEAAFVVDNLVDPSLSVEEIVEHADLQHLLQTAIQRLPATFRSVVLLRYTTWLSFREIGNILQMPESTAKTYFSRAKPFLRTALASHIG